MKNLKKVLSIVLAVAMVLAMGLSVFAQTETYTGSDASADGSITINNATVNQKYTIYKVFDANPSGTEGLVAYTATEAVYTWLSADSTAKELFKFTKNVKGSYNVEAVDDTDDTKEAIIAFFKSLVSESEGTTTVDTTLAGLKIAETTATESSLTFDKIPYGYYVVQSALGAVVSVDTTNKAVTIIDKNQSGPSWDIDDEGTGKAFTDEDLNIITETENGTTTTTTVNSVNYGDTLHYVLGINTTNYDGDEQIIKYFLKDTLGGGLEYDQESIQVFVGTTELGESAYSVEWKTTDGDNEFEVTVPWVNSDNEALYASPNTIKVYYDAVVTDTAVLAGEGNKNTANFTYQTTGNNKTPYDDQNESETTTYVYALGILKVATNEDLEETNTVLSGATFTLTDNDGNAVYVVEKTEGSGVYVLNTSTTGTKSNVVVSPESGLIIIKGLEAGTYKLKETAAPEGYNLVKEDISVEASIAQTSTYTTTIITHYDENGHVVSQETTGGADITTTTDVNVVPVTVENKAGQELPQTGGIGTTVFYMIGSILLIGAGVILITRKRMSI